MQLNLRNLYNYLIYFTACIWFTNGLICKVLNFVPRHEAIVATILGSSFSRPITFAIGVSEIIMGVWVLSRLKSKLNAVVQITVVAVMNLLEFILTSGALTLGEIQFYFCLRIYCYGILV
ncbi:MAG: DoxX-like family protein [Flavobacteriales bacterium]